MLVVKVGYYTYNGIIFGGICMGNATITASKAKLSDIIDCKRQLTNLGYHVDVKI